MYQKNLSCLYSFFSNISFQKLKAAFEDVSKFGFISSAHAGINHSNATLSLVSGVITLFLTTTNCHTLNEFSFVKYSNTDFLYFKLS